MEVSVEEKIIKLAGGVTNSLFQRCDSLSLL